MGVQAPQETGSAGKYLRGSGCRDVVPGDVRLKRQTELTEQGNLESETALVDAMNAVGVRWLCWEGGTFSVLISRGSRGGAFGTEYERVLYGLCSVGNRPGLAGMPCSGVQDAVIPPRSSSKPLGKYPTKPAAAADKQRVKSSAQVIYPSSQACLESTSRHQVPRGQTAEAATVPQSPAVCQRPPRHLC